MAATSFSIHGAKPTRVRPASPNTTPQYWSVPKARLGRHIAGKPLCLYYDGEYREDDADFEPCFPIRREIAVDGVSVRTLPGGRGLALIHRGPYDQLGRSYAKILQHANERKFNLALPTREVYVKGPGMIFKGNPKNYLTEIQLPFTD